MTLQTIPLKDSEICRHLSQDLRALGIESDCDPLKSLNQLEELSLSPSMKGADPLIRVQDFLRKSLIREEKDDSWRRGKLLELSLAFLSGGEPVGNRSQKEDILSPLGSISAKVYSGMETRIQGGHLPKFIKSRTTIGEFFRQWPSLFWDLPFDEEYILRDNGRKIRANQKDLFDLKTLHSTQVSPQLRNNWKYHKVKYRIWRSFLQELFSGLDHWVVIYISDKEKFLDIDWFRNEDIIRFLSPLDRPPPLKLQQGGTIFRFNANKLKREVERSDDFTSGRFYFDHLISANLINSDKVSRQRKKIHEWVEQASPQELNRLGKLITK